MNGIERIAVERQRQIDKEGWTLQHDKQAHYYEELVGAAICYAKAGGPKARRSKLWPWERKWWKPKDRVSNLVRAGALIAAEIDRLLAQAESSIKNELAEGRNGMHGKRMLNTRIRALQTKALEQMHADAHSQITGGKILNRSQLNSLIDINALIEIELHKRRTKKEKWDRRFGVVQDREFGSVKPANGGGK